jgi:Methyltransferase domain
VSGFAPDWLALRESHDLRARNAAVLNAVIASLTGQSEMDIVDLACGTGSTLRALALRLPAKQNWRLVDNDCGLLAHASKSTRPRSVMVTTIEADLNRDLGALLGHKTDLVTTSALLDLVSSAWLQGFAHTAAARSLPVYAALSYDGRIEIAPADEFDKAIMTAVNAHQHTDKGFGAALGPLAAQAAIAQFEALGYAVVHEQADWIAGSQDQPFQIEILRGWASAARELGQLSGSDIDKWLIRRTDFVAAGHSSIRVGHIDFFAQPTGTR